MHHPKQFSIKRNLLAGALLFAAPCLVNAQAPYLFKASDFEITKVAVVKADHEYQMNIWIYFKQSRSDGLPYPFVSLVTDQEGDTLGTQYVEYFVHEGQDTVQYHVTLKKKQVPDFTTCNYYFSGSDRDTGKRDTFLLKYSGEAQKKLSAVPLDGSKISITGISVYNPKTILPELSVSVVVNIPPGEILLSPYLESIVSKNGKKLGDGYIEHQQFDFQRGQDTLVYHLYLRKQEIPDFSECSFIFCCIDPATKKKLQCELVTNNTKIVPAKKSRKKK
jgi:hypothetical protein